MAAGLGQIKVHKQKGNMKFESTYGEDPERTPSFGGYWNAVVR